MKRVWIKSIIIALVLVIFLVTLSSCQGIAKNFGGDITIELEPNTKLETITWKESSLWYLTRPMTEDDIAETHIFRESSEFGILEGTVTIIETKE